MAEALSPENLIVEYECICPPGANPGSVQMRARNGAAFVIVGANAALALQMLLSGPCYKTDQNAVVSGVRKI